MSFFSIQREILINSINEILNRNNLDQPDDLINMLLYGHNSLSDADNKLILEASLEYIKTTKRFLV